MPESTIQPAAAAGIDTFITSEFTASNYGTQTYMDWGVTADPYTRKLLMKFDLSAIAAGSQIQLAQLTLYIQSATPDNSTLSVARVLAANSGWTETGVTWATIDGATPWAGSAGCSTAGTDYDQNNYLVKDLASGVFGSPASFTMTLEATAFQKLIDIGNYGMVLWGSNVIRASTSDHATAGQRPSLYVRWLEPTGRMVEYTFDIWDPNQVLLDAKGAAVQPNEVRPNNWIRVLGFDLPRGRAYDSLIEDPTTSYIVSVTSNEQGVVIKTDRNQFSEVIVQRLAGGAG